MRWTTEARRLACDLAVVLVGLWLGYFLTHTWQTLEFEKLLLAGLGSGVFYAGLRWARQGAGHRPMSLAVMVAGAAAAAMADPRIPFALSLLLVSSLLRGRFNTARPAGRFISGMLFGGAAVCVGLVTALPLPPGVGAMALAFACYIGLAESLAGGRGASRATVGAVLALMLATVLLVASAGLRRPHGIIAAAFSVWLGLRLIWAGRSVLRATTVPAVRRFSELALLGSGLLAAALLAMRIEPADETVGEVLGGVSRSVGEAAWPVLVGLFSVLLIRVWPLVVRNAQGGGDAAS